MSAKNNNNTKGQSLSTPPVINHVDQASTDSQTSSQQASNGAPPPPPVDEEPGESDTDHDANPTSLCDLSIIAPPPSLDSASEKKIAPFESNSPYELPSEVSLEENPDPQTSPIRSAFRRPGDRATKRVTIMPAEDGVEAAGAGAAVTMAAPAAAAPAAEDTSIRVTEKIKKGTFKESQIIFKAGPPLTDTLEKLEKKDDEASLKDTSNSMSTVSSSQMIAPTTPAPVEKGKPTTTEEKKKNREDRKKEKEKKKEEEMLFHHEREQEKKTKIVGTDKYDPDTGETGQWLKHAFLLGEGSYKNVYEGYNSKDGCKIAWCEYKAPFQSSDTETITSESAIMKRLNHPHIVKCFDVLTSYYDLEEKRFNRYLVLIQERMEKDSLKLRVQRSFSEGKQHLSMKVLKRWMLQMVEAVNYLHKQVPIIIHRDLKPENIFMMSRGSEDLDDVKIGDFGLASYRDKTTKKTLAGTFGFMAPEMYGENYDEKVDIYALGMVWLEMFTNRPPFDNLRGNFFEIARYTLQGKYPDNLKDVESEAFRDLILTLTHPIPHWRCSAELLLHHPVLQTKPIPIVALPQYSQEFVANMHKNHKLPISVRLNDKKLRAAYGFDEGQCLDVDIDLWKEQAIHKTVDELQRDIETTLADRGGDAAKFTVPKKWYDSVRMQLLLFRHTLLGQRWRYIYNTLCEKGVEGLPPISTEDGGTQNWSEEFANQHFPPDVDGNSFITSARHINLMNMTSSYMEREMGETSRPPHRGAVLPISDTVLAIASAECGMMRAEKDQQQQKQPPSQQPSQHHQMPPQSQLQHQAQQQYQTQSQQQHAPVSCQATMLPMSSAIDPAMSLPMQPIPVPIPSQPGVPPSVTTWSNAAQGVPMSVAGNWSQTVPMPPPGWPQLPHTLWPTMAPPGQPTPWAGPAFGAMPQPTWTNPPATPQAAPTGGTTPGALYTASQPGASVPTLPVSALHHQYPPPQSSQPVPTLGGPVPDHLSTDVPPAMLASVTSVPPETLLGAPLMPPPLAVPTDTSQAFPSAGPAHATIGSATCAPNLASKLTREVRRVSMPILNGLERVGHNAQRPAHAAWQNGAPKPVAGIYETGKKKRAGAATAQKKRENCKICLTHTDVDGHGVTRMHIQVHLPDRPASVAGQLMNKCIFAVPMTSSLKDIGKQVIEIIQKKQEESPRSSKSMTDFGSEFHELYYGAEMASYIQDELAKIVRLYNEDPKMALPYEVEFAGPQLKSVAAAAAGAVPSPSTTDIAPVRQSSKEESADAVRGMQGCPRCASAPRNDTKSFTALVTGATEGDALVTPTSTQFASDVDRATALTELKAVLDGLSVSQLAVVKDVVANLTKEAQQPLVVVPEGRERRVLPVPANCFFVGVPRRPGDTASGFDVVKGSVGDKFVVSYPREARAPRVWTSTNVFEPVLIMPNDRMYTIDRPAVLHHSAEGPMELLKLPSDGSDKVVSLHGGQASVVEEVSLLLPPRVVSLPSCGAVVVQMSGGGAEPVVLERPCLVIPEPKSMQRGGATPQMRVVELPSNPDPEGLDFVLQFLQLLRDPKAMVAAKEGGAVAAVAAAAASEAAGQEHSDAEGQSNNQNSHTKAPPKRKNSREKQRAAGDLGEAPGPSASASGSAQAPLQTTRAAGTPQTLTQVQVLWQQPQPTLPHQPPQPSLPHQPPPPQQQPQPSLPHQPPPPQQQPQPSLSHQPPPPQPQPSLPPQQQLPQQSHPLQPQPQAQQQMSPQYWQGYQQHLLQQQQYLQQQIVQQSHQSDSRTTQELQQQLGLHYQQQKLLLHYQMLQQQQHLQHLQQQQQQHQQQQQQQQTAPQQSQQFYRPPQGPPVVIRPNDSTSLVGQVRAAPMGQPVMLQPWSNPAVTTTYPQAQPQFPSAMAETVVSHVPSSPRRQAPVMNSGEPAAATSLPLTPTSNEPPSSALSETATAHPPPLANGHGPPIPSETIGRFSIVTVAPVETDTSASAGDD